jgi:mannose-6-phosphate isomerase-like protein (cupin superfamily)
MRISILGGAFVSIPEIVAFPLAGRALAPAGSDIVLAEYSAAAAAGDAPLYQAPLHSHAEAEAWYVLDGALRFRVGDDQTEIAAGGAIVVPGGMAHTFWNSSPGPARYLLVMGPRTHALVRAIHAASDRSPDAMRALYQAHGATLLEP